MKNLLKYLILIVIVYSSLLLVPIFNIPLSDDNLYFDSVSKLIGSGEVVISKELATSFLSQLFYSSAFAKLVGLTHVSLTLLTIILAGVSVLVTFVFLRKFVPERVAFLGSLFLLFTPTFFNLTHTFMTDIHAFYFALLSVIAFHEGLEKKNLKYILLASVLVIISFLIRQWYVILPIGFSLFFFLNQKKIFLQKKYFLAALVLPLAIFALWFYWNSFVYGSAETIKFHLPLQFSPEILANNSMKAIFFSMAFMFPFGLLILLNFKKLLAEVKKTKRMFVLISIAIVILQIAWITYRYSSDLGIIFPGNHVVFMYGSATPGVPGSESLIFWIPVSAIGIFFVFYFLLKIFQTDLRKNFLLYIIVFSVIPLIPTIGVKDRYFLLLIPLVLAFVLPRIKEFRFFREVLVISVVLLALWSWYGTYNYLSWNSADSEAKLFLNGIGGAEDAGGDNYKVNYPYLISPKGISGYSTLKQFGYSDFFNRDLGSLFVLKKS